MSKSVKFVRPKPPCKIELSIYSFRNFGTLLFQIKLLKILSSVSKLWADGEGRDNRT